MAKLLSFFQTAKNTADKKTDQAAATGYVTNASRFLKALFAFVGVFFLWQVVNTYLLFLLALYGFYNLHRLFYPDVIEAAGRRNNIHNITIRTHAKEIVFVPNGNMFTVLLATIEYDRTPEKTATYRAADNTHRWQFAKTAELLTEKDRQVIDFSDYLLTKQQAVRLYRFLITTREPIFNAGNLLKYILIVRSRAANNFIFKALEYFIYTLPFAFASRLNPSPTLPMEAAEEVKEPVLYNGITNNFNLLLLCFCVSSFLTGFLFCMLCLLFAIGRAFYMEQRADRKAAERAERQKQFEVFTKMLEAEKAGNFEQANRYNDILNKF